MRLMGIGPWASIVVRRRWRLKNSMQAAVLKELIVYQIVLCFIVLTLFHLATNDGDFYYVFVLLLSLGYCFPSTTFVVRQWRFYLRHSSYISSNVPFISVVGGKPVMIVPKVKIKFIS